MAVVGRNPMLDVRLNQRALRSAISAFTRRHGPAATDRAVRKVAFDVVAYTTRALNGDAAGYPHPKRIDTGRLRAGWNVAIEKAVGRSAGTTAVAPVRRDGSPSGASPSDGSASWAGTGLARTVTVTNAVEYGPEVEFGTFQMLPGLHLTRGLLVGAKDVFKTVGFELSRAWGR